MAYGDVVQIAVKGQVVNALVARSVEIAPHSPADGKPLTFIDDDGQSKTQPAKEHVDLVYLDPEAENQKGGPTMKVREMRHVAVDSLVTIQGETAPAADPNQLALELGAGEQTGEGSGGVITAIVMLALFIGSLFGGMPARAQQSGQAPVRWYFATDYNVNNLYGQNPNTYTWNMGQAPNPGSCTLAPINGAAPFFAFGTATVAYPEYIRDSNAALSEVVVPSGSQLTGSTCGFTASPLYNHISFWVSSGTAGLYEAVGTNVSQAYVTNVLLDKYWYQALAAIPGQDPVNVITSTNMPGSTHVQIVDITTEPWTFYTWNTSLTKYQLATGNSGGIVQGVVAANSTGAGAGSSISTSGVGSTQIVSLTTGTGTATGTLFTLTYSNKAGNVISGTYTSGLTVVGAKGTQVCLSSFNNSSTANALVTLTSANTIAGSTVLAITSQGTGATAAPTSASAAITGCGITNPATSVTGTATISTVLGNTGAFAYVPVCSVQSIGISPGTTTFTIAATYVAPTTTVTVTDATAALTVSTPGYQFRVVCN
jgi:hypothetical protein